MEKLLDFIYKCILFVLVLSLCFMCIVTDYGHGRRVTPPVVPEGVGGDDRR